MSSRLTYLKDNGYVKEDGRLRHTKVSNFCLPMFDLHIDDFKEKLINVYIQHEPEPHLYVITLPDDNITDVLIRLNNHENFIESYDDDDGKELIFKLSIPSKYTEDYYKVLSGSYSQVSLEYKHLLKKFYGNNVYDLSVPPLIVNNQVATTMWEILNPSIKKREQVAKHFGVDINSVKELISKPDLKYELYKKANQLYNQEEQL